MYIPIVSVRFIFAYPLMVVSDKKLNLVETSKRFILKITSILQNNPVKQTEKK